jgi:hypothetical protein
VTSPAFRVSVQDPNVGDDLFVRFVADFPPLSGNTRFLLDQHVPHTADGKLLFQDVSVTVRCSAVAQLPSHQVAVIVADRDFLLNSASSTQPADPTRLPSDARSTFGSWTLDLECP